MIKDFPDTKDMLEYKDFLEQQTVEMASEFLSRVMEDKAYEIRGRKAYAGYIALRPRAERSGSHGLFTNDGEDVNLTQVMKELDNYNGNLWTAVISLRRADAERLGFNKGERWRSLLRSQTEALSKNMKITMEHLRWYAAFHNESHHPHVHLIVYSADPKEGYLSKHGIEKLRSSIAGDIFKQDLLSVYEKQTEFRNRLKSRAKEQTAAHDNAEIEALIIQLSKRLKNISGKKVYGYLPADVKNLVDEIVNCLSSDKNISELYNLWYEQKEQTILTYTDHFPKRIPLTDNREFKSVKNKVIGQAMKISESGENKDKSFEYSRTSAAESCTALLEYLFRIIENDTDQSRQNRYPESVDRKLRVKILEKKEALGMK